MTTSQHPELVSKYWEGWLDFKGLVCALFDAGCRPREAYAIAVAEEQKYMQALAKRGWERADAV